MRFFDEDCGGKKQTETLVMMSTKDAEIIIKAMEEFVKANKRNKKAKALLNEMDTKWSIY